MNRLLNIALGLCILALSNISNGQQFKWVKGGGGTSPSSGSYEERVEFMCTDANGNVYAVSQMGYTSLSADTFHKSSAWGGGMNIFISSYNCNGQMRWAKLIGSSAGDCIASGIIADGTGHIYLSGMMQPLGGTLHIGYDATFSGTAYQYQSNALIQFDTNGHYNWLRFVGNNAMPTLSGEGFEGSALVVDGANNVHFLNYMKWGVHITPTLTSTSGVYDLSYNSLGTLLSEKRLDADSEWYVHSALIDPVTGKLYICGSNNNYIFTGTFPAPDTSYIAVFDTSRNRIWMKFAGHGDPDFFSGIVMDSNKNLLLSGSTQSPPFYFNGDSVNGSGNLAIIMKADTNGSVKWFKQFICHGSSVNYFTGIALLPNGKVAACGTYAGTVFNGYDSIVTPSGEGWNPYLVIVDSASDVQRIQNIHGDGFNEGSAAITSDRAGNIYVGGEVADSIWGDYLTIPAYHSAGGPTDFFVMKYGMDCSCTGIPMSVFTDTGGIHMTVGAIYTGTTTGIDSVVWAFGDGYKTTGLSATHTYTVSDTFRVCATVYTTCGNDIYCKDVLTGTVSAISPVAKDENIHVYPNPARDELSIVGLSGTANMRLLSVTGSAVLSGMLANSDNTISLKNCSQGIYLLEIVSSDGTKHSIRVIKQ